MSTVLNAARELLNSDPWWTGTYYVECSVCRMSKKPLGRSAPAETENSLCGHDCPGYRQHPLPGELWPGEKREDFGYPKAAADLARLIRAKDTDE